ncbi:ribonucleases P/MRP protein subunit POP1-domain-containing protein [Calycina marina]|uniref:Ribonucleases P/MRP protein subunit POP1-domain-containing protein n=1 Tax=Calycina marina TaxID=1763456 RepID=A0A9P7ZAE6_9HELO|nr:ribonucleases P/MRP protein subunit POP1-domain-containing protein [Calycina marina]
MAPKPGDAPRDGVNSKKRKDPPPSSNLKSSNTKQFHPNKRVKAYVARNISSQPADAALKNGELDLPAFLKSREFEIKAMEDAMVKTKKSLNLRAFQQMPRDLRRRTASHNVKRVPKRIQKKHAHELKQDNAPLVDRNKRKPNGSRGRIRAETAKRLGILAAKKKAEQKKEGNKKGEDGIQTRSPRPKIRMGKLNDPQKPKSKFRKRQVHKSWLPTHLWHAKRATMTEPAKPLWRFAIPITSTEKSYRPTHRATGARGAVAWDTSYLSTIGLEGTAKNAEKVLKAIGVVEPSLWEERGQKWRDGKRTWSGWLSREHKGQRIQIGPAIIMWCPAEAKSPEQAGSISAKTPNSRLFIRVHPSAFLETWTELLRVSKQQRPMVLTIDLRFEIGSIQITGPGSTEALLGILQPISEDSGRPISDHGQVFKSLAGVTNSSALPLNALLSFSVSDPRLRYPPQRITLPDPQDQNASFAQLQMLSSWPADESIPSPALFDRDARHKATRLPSQKAINRRKSLAKPGAYPDPVETDPSIPIMLFTSRSTSASSAQGVWTLMAPWKCILPIWYGLMHFPLSTGNNPRFGGIQELRQTHFEHGMPWFPADYPSTAAGHAWEAEEMKKREAAWSRRPKGKRVEWATVDLGAKRKGEIGRGWACDFEKLVGLPVEDMGKPEQETETDLKKLSQAPECPFEQVSAASLRAELLAVDKKLDAPLPPITHLATISLTPVTRGVAYPCARIYRLPAELSSPPSSENSPTTRKEWLALLPAYLGQKAPPNPKKSTISRIPLDAPLPQRVRLLAQSLIQPPPSENDECYPLVPDEEDLIGFVTTGEFNLAEGKGRAIGSVILAKVLEAVRRDGKCGGNFGRLCIVRNAGERVGRLATWTSV